jgi:hypothetical protein
MLVLPDESIKYNRHFHSDGLLMVIRDHLKVFHCNVKVRCTQPHVHLTSASKCPQFDRCGLFD